MPQVNQPTLTHLVRSEHSNEHHKGVSSHVAANESITSSKKKAVGEKANKKASKSGKNSKLTSVKDDIQVQQASNSVGSDAPDTPHTAPQDNSGGGLFGGFGDHWQIDPLTEFMFYNAPELIELCQRSQDAMMKAEVTQTKEQTLNALFNAKDTIAKGRASAEQQNLKAAGEFAQAGVAALQSGLQAKDFWAGSDTYSRDLDAHDQVMSALTSAPAADEEMTTGTARNATEDTNPVEELQETLTEGQISPLSAEEKATINKKAAEFKEIQRKRYLEDLNGTEGKSGRKGGWRSAAKQNPVVGLGRSTDSVAAETDLLSNRVGSQAAYKEVLGEPGNSTTLSADQIKDQQAFHELLDGDTPKSAAARKQFMTDLFQENEGEVPMDIERRMDVLGDWGQRGGDLRQKMLRSYGTTEAGGKMRNSFGEIRANAANRANIESSNNRRIMDTRQILLQNCTVNGLNAIFDQLQKKYIVEAAKREASATLDASIAQMNGQAKSSEDSFVASSIKDMTGIYEWFQSMHGQLLSAQTSMMGA